MCFQCINLYRWANAWLTVASAFWDVCREPHLKVRLIGWFRWWPPINHMLLKRIQKHCCKDGDGVIFFTNALLKATAPITITCISYHHVNHFQRSTYRLQSCALPGANAMKCSGTLASQQTSIGLAHCKMHEIWHSIEIELQIGSSPVQIMHLLGGLGPAASSQPQIPHLQNGDECLQGCCQDTLERMHGKWFAVFCFFFFPGAVLQPQKPPRP